MSQSWKKGASFVIKTSLLFCALSAAFSFVGMLLPEKGPLPSPVGGLNLHEIGGHLFWGLLAGAAFLSVRYFIITGIFAVLIDSDHLIALLHVDALPRMSHSIAFGVLAVVVLMALFGRKDYKLGAAAIAAVLSHLSFDTFAGYDGRFPLFVPFYNHQIIFQNIDWIYFEVAAVTIVGIVTILTKRQTSKLEANV
jgi:hypothetical protein